MFKGKGVERRVEICYKNEEKLEADQRGTVVTMICTGVRRSSSLLLHLVPAHTTEPIGPEGEKASHAPLAVAGADIAEPVVLALQTAEAGEGSVEAEATEGERTGGAEVELGAAAEAA
eukprot:g54998.t1